MSLNVTLTVDGVKHAGWKSVHIRRSLETIADSFDLSVTERWSGQSRRRPIRAGAECMLSIEDDVVLTGYVDDAIPNYNADEHTIEIAGRSKTGDLVDCAHNSNEDFKGKTFLQAADTVCFPFGINVELDADVGAPFARKQVMDRGETVFDFLERLARYRALRMVATPEGNLLITRASNVRVNTPLILGQNILSASGAFSQRDRFSQYQVYGQSTGDDETSGAPTAEAYGESSDDRVNRYRPTVIMADGDITTDECKRQAQWHRNTRFGRSGAVVYTVLGWRHDHGLWQPNRLVSIVDAYTGVFGDRLISGVQYIFDDQGQRCELQVMPPEAFDLVVLPEPDKDDEDGFF
jgi:prophage tail gpP-like protein